MDSLRVWHLVLRRSAMTPATAEAEVQAPEAEEQRTERTRPVHTIGPVWTVGATVTVNIWRNPVGDGEHFNYRVTAQRSYKQNGEWKNTASFQRTDLLALSQLLEQAWCWMNEHRDAYVG